MSDVPSVNGWATNAELIKDVAKLYLSRKDYVLDATYGLGNFWTLWRPVRLHRNDLWAPAGTVDTNHDFQALPFETRKFDVVVFDPDYKLNGTPAMKGFDERYGLAVPKRWQDRMEAIRLGAKEAARCSNDRVLVKCQDQVCSGQMRWQTDLVTEAVLGYGYRKVDRFDMLGGGVPQPEGRKQVHALGRGSTLLVFSRVD